MPNERPRIALIVPYWSFWEKAAGGEAFRSEREGLLSSISTKLALIGIEVVQGELVDSEAAGAEVATEIASTKPDALVVAQTMAVPPSYAMSVIDSTPGVPLVVWALQLVDTISPDFDESDITSYGATVGAPMLTNVLGRRGRPYSFVFAPGGQAIRGVGEAVRAAVTANRLGSARLALIDRPIDGYECVDVDSTELREALGVEVVELDASALLDRYREASSPTQAILDEIRTGFTVDEAVDEESMERAAGIAAALAGLDDELLITMGALNCHIPELRFGDDPGMTACYGVGRETTRGIPWTCVGDAITAIAMFVGHSLGGAALYHEIEAVDFDTGEVAIANSGEHDLGWCPRGIVPRLIPNRWFKHDDRTTPAVWFELPPGPATLIGFTPHASAPRGFRFIAAEGEITPRSLPSSPTVGGSFRFREPLETAWPAWANAGVNHHSAVSPGHLAKQVEMVSNYLGVGCVRV